MVEPMEDSQHVIAVLAAGLQWRPHRRRHQYANKPFAEDPRRYPSPFVGHGRYLLRSKPRQSAAVRVRLGTSFVNPDSLEDRSSDGDGPTGELLLDRCQWNFTALPLFLDSPIPQPRRKDVFAEGRAGPSGDVAVIGIRWPSRACATEAHFGLGFCSQFCSQLGLLRLNGRVANTWKVKSTPRPLGHTQFADPTSGLRRQVQTQCSRLA